MDGDGAVGAEGQGLGGGLGLAVQDEGVEFADGVLAGRGAVGRRNDEGVAGAADAGAGGDDVEAGAVSVGREEADGVAVGVPGLAGLLGQADRGERAAGAEPLVLRDRGPLGRLAHAVMVRRQLMQIFNYRREAIGRLLGPLTSIEDIAIRPLR